MTQIETETYLSILAHTNPACETSNQVQTEEYLEAVKNNPACETSKLSQPLDN